MQTTDIDISAKEDTPREIYVQGAIEKIFDTVVRKCSKKCDSGFIPSPSKKVSNIADMLYGTDTKCSCYKDYELYKAYTVSQIPREFWKMKDADLQIDADAKQKLNLYRSKLSKCCDEGIGILFIGSPEGIEKPNLGVGKTSSAIQILENVLELNKTAHYLTMHQYFNFAYRVIGSQEVEKEKYLGLLDEIESVDVLCIDEIGKMNKTDYVYYRFEDMIRKRSSQLLVTIFVTNMNEGELEDFIGHALMDIIKNSSMKIRLVGNSYRSKRFSGINNTLFKG